MPRISTTMDSYAFPLPRTYGAPQSTHSAADATHAQYTAEHPQVPYQHAGYGINYDYAVHPPYAQHAWEPAYLQAQPASAYSFPPAPSPSPGGAAHISPVQIYAPVPVSPYSTLVSPISPLSKAASETALAPEAAGAGSSVPHAVEATSRQSTPEEVPRIAPTPTSSVKSGSGPVTAEQSPLEYYGNAPQVMFPTPSQLLSELSARDASGPIGESSRKASVSNPPISRDTKAPEATSSKNAKSRDGSQGPAVPAPKPPAETQRKAYFRRVAEAVGFPPTDPDSITSHDKKRSYLECLEQYVQWLHEQIRLVGREPLPIERVQQYRGPSSRSIRTLLVHMQDEVRELHQQTLEDERTYMHMQAQLQMQRAPMAAQQLPMQRASMAAQQMRRHSVAACGLPDTSLSPAPFLQPYPQY